MNLPCQVNPIFKPVTMIIIGALVQDTGKLHEDEANPNDPIDVALCWRHECWFNQYDGHARWLEVHPVDSIRRVPEYLTRQRRMKGVPGPVTISERIGENLGKFPARLLKHSFYNSSIRIAPA